MKREAAGWAYTCDKEFVEEISLHFYFRAEILEKCQKARWISLQRKMIKRGS